MRFLTNPKWLLGTGLALACLIAGSIFLFRPSAREIPRTELDQLLQANAITRGHIRPTPYAGIYEIEGRHKTARGAENINLTLHVNETEIKELLANKQLKFE